MGINNNVQIAGSSGDGTSFFLNDGIFNSFIVGSTGTLAYGLNDNLQIVGLAPASVDSGFVATPQP